MPNMYKLVLFYRLAAQGWTETFYREAETASAATDLASNFIGKSSMIRAGGIEFQGIRASNIAGTRDTFLRLPNHAVITASRDADLKPDITAVSALYRLYAAGGKSRNIWFRGLPDADTIRERTSGISTPTEAYRDLLDRYKDAMVFNSLRVQSRVVNPADTATFTIMSPVTPPQAGFVKLNFGAFPPAWVQGDKIDIGGPSTEDYPQLKGRFEIQVKTDTHVIIRVPGFTFPGTDPVIVIFGARRLAYEYPLIQTGQFVRFSTHDTGRPFGVPRGRRAVRRR